MTDPAITIRARFPRWKTDPYQKVAVDAVLRILFAGENAERELARVETCLAFFLEDPPLSLSFDTPHRQAETLARKLEALGRELRKGAAALRSLDAYIDQFTNDPPGTEDSHELRGQDHRDESESSTDPSAECPF